MPSESDVTGAMKVFRSKIANNTYPFSLIAVWRPSCDDQHRASHALIFYDMYNTIRRRFRSSSKSNTTLVHMPALKDILNDACNNALHVRSVGLRMRCDNNTAAVSMMDATSIIIVIINSPE
jgi:hypothetical protein